MKREKKVPRAIFGKYMVRRYEKAFYLSLDEL